MPADAIWDAIVVGAGPAGCAAAYDLAAAGRRVLLLDTATFPRVKACAGGLTMKAVHALRYPIDPVVRRWERAVALEQAPGRGITVRRRKPVCAMTVRAELDSFCLEQTIARGAEFRRIPGIAGLAQGADSVTVTLAPAGNARAGGARADAEAGSGAGALGMKPDELRARFILGADGVHSRVRALLGAAPWFRTGFAVEANVPYRAGNGAGNGAGNEAGNQARHEAKSGRYPLTFDFAPVTGGYGWLFPRDTHVNVGLYVEDGGAGGVDKAALARYIELRCGAGRPVDRAIGQFLGLGAAGYRPAQGTRVLLAGDAAGFVDPLTGEGIYGAIRSGQAAAEAMLGALREADSRASGRAKDREMPLAERFLRAAGSLQADLRIAEHGARRFHAEPARAWAMLRVPGLGRLALEVYAEGMRLRGLLQAARLAGRCAGLWRRTRQFIRPG